MAQAVRTSWAVTLSVWRALVLREAVARLFSSRVSFIWLVGEPVAHVMYLIFIYTRVKVHKIAGLDAALWLMVGIIAYYQFRKVSNQVISATKDNRALFAYRQVKPIDTIFARAYLELVLSALVLFILILLNALQGHSFAPDYPLTLLGALFALWLLGLGFGMCMVAFFAIAPDARHFYTMMMRPMYLISGVLFPIGTLPHDARVLFLLNPVACGLEMARESLSSSYAGIPELDPWYLYEFAFTVFLIGIALNRLLERRIAER